MATPPTADALVAALRAEGLTVIEYKSWRTHNRNSKGPWGSLNGVMLHHTVSRGSTPQQEADSVSLCYYGYEGLLGPLCQAVIAKSGRVYMVGHGRCNHAGGGDPNVLQAVTDEQYLDRPPVPRVGNKDGVDGNARFIGAECINLGDGKDPWPAAQVDAMVRFSAAICRMNRWTSKSVIAHAEWSKDKSDPLGPGYPGHTVMRAKIAERLAHSPSWSPDEQGPEMTKPDRLLVQRTEDMTLAENAPQAIYWTTEYPDDANGHGNGGKTVGSNIVYDAVLNLSIDGLGMNEMIEVVAGEENSSGVLLGESAMRHTIYGVGVGAHPLQVSVPFSGHAAERLVFRVVSRAVGDVTIREAWLSMHSWPLS